MYLDDVLKAQKSQKDNESQARDLSRTAALWSSLYIPSGAVISSVFLSNTIDLCRHATAAKPGELSFMKNYYESAAISAGVALAPVLFGALVIAAFLHMRRNYLSNAAQAYRDQLASSV
ncbi:MAG TPA: hypothetical protein VI612_00440 [Candidatus Nanoarchaeia archaeon]|nr:hypothetical protein [Candidatus Nanoarchaeia archaeon]